MADTQKDLSTGIRYLQTNQLGYVTGVVEEEILSGLHGQNPRDFRILTIPEAEEIERRLKDRHSKGEGLHISEIAYSI